MIDGIYIIHRLSGRLLLERNFEQLEVDTDLFSSLLSAIRSFTKAIHMGELTSFTTHNKQILISITETLIVALIMNITASAEKWQGTAYEVGCQFDQTFNVKEWDGNRSEFGSFNETLDLILKVKEDPFVIQVVKWATKEFGGDIHINQKLLTDSEKEFLVDIIIDRGELNNLSWTEKALDRFHRGYNRDLIFFRIMDGSIGSNELEQIIELCKDLRIEYGKNERAKEYFDYFPSQLIIIARDFSPLALEKFPELTNVNKKQNKYYIISDHLSKHRKISEKKGKQRIFQCQVELWRWKTPYPEHISI